MPLGRFWAIFWTQAPRGFQNRAFWHQVAKKSRKMRSRRRSWKHMKKSWIFDGEMWGFGHAKPWIFINFTGELQCRRVFRLFHKSIETSQKMYAKMAPKRLQNRAWRHLGTRFLKFWELLDDTKFWWVVETANSGPKIEKWRSLGGQVQLPGYLSCLRQYTRSGPRKRRCMQKQGCFAVLKSAKA